MKRSILNIRIPTLLGIFFIVVTLSLTSYLANTGVIIIGRASLTDAPKDVRITNITDSSFAISYTTEAPITGVVNFGKDKNLGQIVLDVKDKDTGNKNSYYTHYFVLQNLTPDTSYYFSIASGGNTYFSENSPLTTKTLKTSSIQIPSQTLMNGKVVTENGVAVSEGIIYVKTQISSYTLSTQLKNDGTYTLNIALLKNQNDDFIQITPTTILQMLIVSNLIQSSVVIKASDIYSVPTITIGQNYDFSQNSQLPNIFDTSLSFPSASIVPKNYSPQIVHPIEGETFSDTRPIFNGIASPSASVKITINSDETISETIKTDSQGRWSYRPAKALSPGRHTLSIITQDQSGIQKTLQQNFIVFASGSQFIEPSVSPINSTPTPTQIVPTPTLIFLSPTTVPTIIPSPTQVATATPIPVIHTSNIPPAGNVLLERALLGLVTTVVISFLLFLLSSSSLRI